jgi:hypothetical protein
LSSDPVQAFQEPDQCKVPLQNVQKITELVSFSDLDPDWIRIQLGLWIRIQKGKKPKKRKKLIGEMFFEVLDVTYFLGTGGFPCSLKTLYNCL